MKFLPEAWMWRLPDGRVWSTEKAKFVDEEAAFKWAAGKGLAAVPLSPVDTQGERSLEGLRQALIAYGLPLGTLMVLEEARAVKTAEIQSGYEAALTAGLTMPSAQAPASALELALAIVDWQAESPEDFADLRAIHAARRDELLAAVEAADTVEAVKAVEVSYAV